MKTSRQIAVAAAFIGWAWLSAGGCSASADVIPSAGQPNTGGGSGGARGEPTVVAPDPRGVAGATGENLNPLCGGGEVRSVSCVPDDANACGGYEPPLEPSGEGGTATADVAAAGAGGAGGAKRDAGMSAGGNLQTGGAANGMGGSGDSGNAGGPSAAGGGGAGNTGPGQPATYSCQVARGGDQATPKCERAGAGKANAPCFSTADCAPSLACVNEGDAGRCLPYCCSSDTRCAAGSYCGDRPLRAATSDTSRTPALRVPVCVPADDCSLEDPFPCRSGSECRCKGDTACMVVRDDGTTACVAPGKGDEGEACPCAWNRVCSAVTKKCAKICHTDPSHMDCGKQKCQASAELPKNYGVCVGPIR